MSLNFWFNGLVARICLSKLSILKVISILNAFYQLSRLQWLCVQVMYSKLRIDHENFHRGHLLHN